MQHIIQYLLVFLGGGLGSTLRYGLSVSLAAVQVRFPLATFLANFLACFLLGILSGLFLEGALSQRGRLFFATGLCGGFSTFSTFTAETHNLWEQGAIGSVVLNVVGSIVVCWLSFFMGFKLSGRM